MINVRAYQALAIARALELYAEKGIKINTHYTPRAMMAAAERLTGQTFKSRDYLSAAKELRHYAYNS